MKPIQLRPQRKLPTPSAELEPPERTLWRKIVSTYDFGDDSAALALLAEALVARGRARRCRTAIDRDGEVVPDRFGQLRQHPLLPAERGAQSTFIAGLKALNLNMGDVQ